MKKYIVLVLLLALSVFLIYLPYKTYLHSKQSIPVPTLLPTPFPKVMPFSD